MTAQATDPDIEQPQGSCVLCHRRDPYREPVCDACRDRLPKVLGDIRIKTEQLAQPEPAIRDSRTGVFHRRYWVTDLGWTDLVADGYRDPVASATPAAPVAGQQVGRMYSRSSPGSRPPLPLDRVDLTASARVPNPTRSRGDYPRSWWPEDQIGQQPVATILESWVRDWIDVRDMREHRPEPTVEVLTRWLADRCDWACDHHPAVDEFASEMFQLRDRLSGVLGQFDRPDYKDGVACPDCGYLTLVQDNGSEWVECATCPALLSEAEYGDLVAEQAGAVRATPAAAA